MSENSRQKMRIKEFLDKGVLNSNSISRGELEVILARVLGVDRSYLVAHEEEEISSEVLESVVKITTRRDSGEPLAYIFGVREFYGREFLVDSRVLIPRPETETIIDILAKEDFLKGFRRCYGGATGSSCNTLLSSEAHLKNPLVLDIGTGSGCIGITAGIEMPQAKVIATDVSKAALMLASENAKRLGAKNITFMESDLLSGFSSGISSEGPLVICANLPYVATDWEWIDKKALGYEPEIALYAEDGGLALIKKLILQVVEYDFCAPEVILLLEADKSQHEAIIKFAESSGLHFLGAEGYILSFSKYMI